MADSLAYFGIFCLLVMTMIANYGMYQAYGMFGLMNSYVTVMFTSWTVLTILILWRK